MLESNMERGQAMPTIAAILGEASSRTTFKVGDWVTTSGEDSIARRLSGRGFRVIEVESVPCTCMSDAAALVVNGLDAHEPSCRRRWGSDQLVTIDFDGEEEVFDKGYLALATPPPEEE